MYSKRPGLFAAFAISSHLLPFHAQAQGNGDNPCESAAELQAEILESVRLRLPGDILYAGFDAATAFACISDVALDSDAAVTMIGVIKEYLDFQTTVPYNEDPPDSYQQSEIDLIGRLDGLSQDVQDGAYENQYSFDVALRAILVGAHDGHLSLDLGVLGLFSWILPDTIVSVSSDGQEIPEVYAYSDILNDVQDASPIVQIEGESVFDYLRSYVNRTQIPGLLEPHAEWNQLMYGAASQFSTISSGVISRWPTYFEQTQVYNGESISGEFANGTEFEWVYQAGSLIDLESNDYTSAGNILELHVQQSDSSSDGFSRRGLNGEKLPPILSPRDYHRSLILAPRQDGLSGSETVPVDGFPNDPVVVQEDLGVGGVVTGYILEGDVSVGVLSIPSFMSAPEGAGSSASFSEAVDSFIREAQQAEVSKIVIDLSGNTGGVIFQGFDTFKRFFPTLDPQVGFRTRASPNQGIIGELFTGIIENVDDNFDFSTSLELASAWGTSIPFVSTYSTNVDGEAWQSWDEFYGPREIRGDNFTNTARYNLSSPVISLIFGDDIAGYGSNRISYDQPWAAEDIVLLQDGACASTCAIFSEMMKSDAGVKTVVVGGIPQNGPMQGVSGTRGSNTLQWSIISATVQILQQLASFERSAFRSLLSSTGITTTDLQSLPSLLEQTPWAIRSAAVNVLDMVRPASDSPDDPVQFAYEGSDCRLFYTAPMVRDISALWQAAAQFANGDSSVCVSESTDGPGLDPDVTFFADPGFSGDDVWENANSTEVLDNGNRPEEGSGNGGSGGDGGDDEGSAVMGSRTSLWALLLVVAVTMITSF